MDEIKIAADTIRIKNLVKRMKRRPHITGIQGLAHMNIIERFRGISDAKNHQINTQDETPETPYVLRLIECLNGYANRTYSVALQELSDLYREAATLNTEIENIRNRVEEDIDETGEEAIRQQEALKSRIKKDLERADEIRVRTSWIKENFEIADESVKHHVEHANGIMLAKLSEYWRGVLRGSAGGIDLPSHPEIREKNNEGYEAYRSHLEQVNLMIDNILFRNRKGEIKH